MSYKDSYIIEETLLGSGQYGQVKNAQSKKNKDLKVCVKILQKQLSFGMKEITPCQEEELNICKYMMNTNNENLVQIYDVYDSDVNDDQTYIFMEKCDLNLEELMDRIKSGQSKEYQNFSKEKLFDIITQIVKGYNSLISKKIIHRDLKPQNILCNIRNNEYIFKIADFGLSKVFNAQKNYVMTKKVGTPYYLAPEVIHSESYDNKCDIFSLGVIIFELALLQRQFKQKEIKNLKEKSFSQLHQDVLNIKVIDQDIVKLLDKMIVYDTNQRITWEELLKYDMKNPEIQPSQSPTSNFNTINQPQSIQPNSQEQPFTNQPQKRLQKQLSFNQINYQQPQQQLILQNNFTQFPQNQGQANFDSDKKKCKIQYKKQNSLQPEIQQFQQDQKGQQSNQRFTIYKPGQNLQSQVTSQLGQQFSKFNEGQQGLLRLPQQQEQLGLQGQQGQPRLPVQTDFPGQQKQPSFPGQQGQPNFIGQQGQSGFPLQPGVTGQQGLLGLPRQTCLPGQQGQSGQPGQQGQSGQPGQQGQSGQPGQQGQSGQPGQQGQPSFPGQQGQLGLPGQQGQPGLQKQTGFIGYQGQPGQKGQTGMQGQLISTQFQQKTLNQNQNVQNQNFQQIIKLQQPNQQNPNQRSDNNFLFKPLNQNGL